MLMMREETNQRGDASAVLYRDYIADDHKGLLSIVPTFLQIPTHGGFPASSQP